MDFSDGYRRARGDRKGGPPRTPEDLVAAYASLRKSFGFDTRELGNSTRSLLRFMRKRKVRSFGKIDRRLASEWLYSDQPQEMTVNVRLGVMRGFFRYLAGLGVVKANLWESFSHARPKRFIPHIYSLAELRAVLDHVRRGIRPNNRGYSRARGAYYAMFHTVYACGLRAGEICRLTLGDVDFERSIFTVRETKFGKTRLVPFNSRTRELVREYINRFRLVNDGMPPEAPLFLSIQRKGYAATKFGANFTRMCRAAGIYRPKRIVANTVYGSTNLHALRHSFAVHRLLKWYEEGADVNAKLPLLATYMGHAEYRNTQKYLRVLPIFIDIAKKLFADGFEGPLRDIECPDVP